MSDIEREIQRWRGELERQSGLAAREVDELEDHLRARLEVEMVLNQGLAPTRVFRDVRDEIGGARELSREFAKAGWPRWRRFVVAGWALFVASHFLPVFGEFTTRYGYDFFWARWPICLPMVLTLLEAGRGDLARSRVLVWLNAAVLCFLVVVAMDELIRGRDPIIYGDTIRQGSYFIGYWIWTASQSLVTAGLWLRTTRWVGRGSRGQRAEDGRLA